MSLRWSLRTIASASDILGYLLNNTGLLNYKATNNNTAILLSVARIYITWLEFECQGMGKFEGADL